jgi:hypothetical protein
VAVYTQQVRTSWKILAALVVVALIGAGCGGISASQSVSPATFLLPGLLKNCPQCPATNEVVVLMENSAPLAFSR